MSSPLTGTACAAMAPGTGFAMSRPEMPTPIPPSPPRRRILLVDDNAPSRIALARLLEREGYETISASDGASALAALRDGPAPAVILTDMMLPDLDGRELGRHAREMRPRPLVMLLTGWGQELEAEGLEPWGIDFMFLKPFDLRKLLDTLDAALRDQPA